MHKNATKCNKTQSEWCKNRHGASKIIDTFETYQYITSIREGEAKNTKLRKAKEPTHPTMKITKHERRMHGTL
jgi:hypothetical protein